MKSVLLRVLTALAFLTPVLALPADPSAAGLQGPQVESFSPEGYVRHIRQVVVRFTVPMVALGDPRLADPFTVSCAAPGKGRWADTRNWVYDFDRDLGAGLSCRFTLRPGLKSLAGETLRGRALF